MGRTTIRETVREEVDERGRAAGIFSGMRVVGASQMATTKENGRKYCSEEVSNREREEEKGLNAFRYAEISSKRKFLREGCGEGGVPQSGGLVPRRNSAL